MKKISIKILITLFLVLTPAILIGQDAQIIKRLTAPVEFDGRPFEEAWNGLEYFPMSVMRPSFGSAPSEISEIMMTYDNEFLWVGARLYTKDATTIASKSKKRDEQSRGSDSFGVILDTYNDNENALAFFTMPTGLRTDYSISNDASGGNSGGGGGGGGGGAPSTPGGSSVNISWNTFWDVKTTRDEKGWYVEMRIPFSSLRFQPENDISTMGLIINRTIPSKNETETYPSIDPKFGNTANMKPSLASTIQFEGAKPSKPVYISPYVIGGFARDWALNTEETQYVKKDNPDFNAGLDVKYSINSNLTLDLTANTDFAQVEADNQQVNLTRYSLFFPEKRAFFQERSSLFSFSLGGSSNLFYSRNIGMSRGTPIRIYGGARLAGRIGKWDMGFIDMQTEEHDATPGENFGIFRMRRSVINPNSYVGGIFTSRLGMNGQQNFAYGVDGIFKLFGEDYLDVKVAQTYDKETDNKIASLDPTFFRANWERRSEKGFAYNVTYSYSGKQFDPGIGFVQKASLQGVEGELLYGWLPGQESRFFSFGPTVRFERFSRLEDGKLESSSINPGWEWNTKKGYGGQVSVDFQQEGVLRDFALSDSVWVRAGEYSFVGFRAMLRTPMSKPISVNLNVNGGEFYDGQKYTVMLTPTFNVSSSLQLSGSYSFNAVRFPDRATNNKLDIHSANIKALVMVSTKLSASVLLQYMSTEDDLIANFRLRYNPREGNDFYLVYNEFRGIGSQDEILALPTYYNRTVMLKYTHTFQLSF